MLTFGAESPREEIDHAVIQLYADDLGFVVLQVKIGARELDVRLRLDQPTARDLARSIEAIVSNLEREDVKL